MTSQSFQYILLGALAIALVFAAYTDWRERIIENWLNLGIALCAPLFWWATGVHLWPDAALQIGLFLLATLLFAGFFALGAMGGGDVKLLGALALWIPPVPFISFLMVMSILGGLLTVIMMARQKLLKLTGPLEVPYGVAISLAALWSIYERYLNHFG
jgi:prepilin peptidase CpaA